MTQRAAQVTLPTGDDDQLSEVQLEQVAGGVIAVSPAPTKWRPPALQWSGTPYQPEEDVEAY